MPAAPSAGDDPAALRAANARLREVVGSKDTEIAVLSAQVEALSAQVAEVAGAAEAEPVELVPAALQRGAGQAGACAECGPGQAAIR